VLTLEYDGEVLHDLRDESRTCTGVSLALEANQPGTLCFTIPPSHPLHGMLRAMDASHEVVALEDGDEVFRGRITDDGEDMRTRTSYTAEGMLAYLNDTTVRPYGTYVPTDGTEWELVGGTVTELMRWYLAQHDAHADANKQFTLGLCEPSGTVTRSSTQRPKTNSEISDKILTPMTAYARVSMQGGRRVIDILDDGGSEASQRIEFGTNLLDFASTRKASGIVTCIVATGRDSEGNEFGLDRVTDGQYGDCHKDGDRIQSCEGARLYGIIEEARSYEVSTPDGLLKAAMDDLSGCWQTLESLDISAVDLHAIDPSVQPIRLYDWVRITSKPHGVDQRMMCSKVTMTDDPSQTKVTLGSVIPSLTHSNVMRASSARLQVEQVIQDASAISADAKAAATVAGEAALTADSKRRVFVTEPVPPYDVGDLWVDQTAQTTRVCTTAKEG
jgi:hypothetical protein